MTLAQALQFYAPLAELLMVVFLLGFLNQRVSTLEREERIGRVGINPTSPIATGKAGSISVPPPAPAYGGRAEHEVLVIGGRAG